MKGVQPEARKWARRALLGFCRPEARVTSPGRPAKGGFSRLLVARRVPGPAVEALRSVRKRRLVVALESGPTPLAFYARPRGYALDLEIVNQLDRGVRDLDFLH